MKLMCDSKRNAALRYVMQNITHRHNKWHHQHSPQTSWILMA